MSDASVLVAVRMRPLNTREKNLGDDIVVKIGKNEEAGSVQMLRSNDMEETEYRNFKFDFSYDKDCLQKDVYNDVGQPLLDKAFDGFNGTIFAYGQTGSGKTWSMSGDTKSEDQKGIIPRICEALFARIRKDTSESQGKKKFMVICSYFEIYNEMLRDLLDPERSVKKRGPGPQKITQLQIKESKALGVYVKGLHEVVVDDENKIMQLMNQGNSQRTSGETKMNNKSSRSHSIFTMKIHQKDAEDESRSVFARLNLVDLAGSERASKTEAMGSRLKEGANINKSLMALGNVINALAEKANMKDSRKQKKAFIPYRNSKLTRVLQESLGGNSLCSMLATLSPARSNLEETLSTIQYANRAKMIAVKATKNEEMSQIDSLNDEIAALKKKLADAGSASGSMSGLSTEAQKKMTAQYEKQISEINNMLSSTWEDKANLSKQHEEERAALVEQRKKEQEEMKLKFEMERQRRWKLLEDKGDVEGILRELVSGSNVFQPPTTTNLNKDGNKNDNDLQDTKKNVSGLHPQQVETWCCDFRDAKKSERAMNEQRMVLQVYRDSFESDMKAMNGESGLKKLSSSFKMIGGSPDSKQDKQQDTMSQSQLSNSIHSSSSAMNPMSPGSQPNSIGGLPPHRMKVILEQAHNKILTLKNEGAVWIQHSEKLFEVCKMLATRIAQKLGKAPPGQAPSSSFAEENTSNTTSNTLNTSTFNPENNSPASPSSQNNGASMETQQSIPLSNSISDAPIGIVSEEVIRTKEYLIKYLIQPKPPLSIKLLSRPPYRYLHDLIMALREETGFTTGLFTEEEIHSAKSTPRNIKISFLQKLVTYTSLIINRRVDVFSDPEQIVAGLECNKTNRFLQCVVEAVTTVIDSSDTSHSATNIFQEYSIKTLRGDKPSEQQQFSPRSTINNQNGQNQQNNNQQNNNTSSNSNNTDTKKGRAANTNAISTSDSTLVKSLTTIAKRDSFNLTGGVPSKLSVNDVAGLELVLRLLRDKYLSDVARLESKRDRAKLFSCGSAAAKLARVLRLEARKCLDESLKGEGAGLDGVGENGDKLTEMARTLESHASIVEPQVPSAPSNRSPIVNKKDEDDSEKSTSSSSLERLVKIMKALVVFRSCISTRITRTKELERQARDLGSQQLTTLTTQHSELQTQYSKQLELYKRMEVNITTLTESEKRLNDKIMNLEKQREDDREAASILREKVAQTAAIEMDKLDSAEVAKELALEKSKSMELEEKCRQHLIDLTQLKEESTMNISELTRVRLLQTESETQSSNLLMKLNEEEKKNNTYTVENENLKTRLGEMEVELETAGMDNARSDELTQEVLALKAQHAQIESRSNELQEMVDSKSRDIERLKEDVINASKSSNRLEEVEEEFTMAVEILTEERDTARQKEEEYFEELQATSNDLADIQAGYVDLSDRLNDKTDQIFECQEDLDAERYKCSELREQLTKTQKELLEKSKLLLKVRAAKGLDRKEERTTATTPATPSKNPVSAPDSTTSASTNSPTTNPSTATTEMSSSPTQQLQQQEHQENQEQQESSQKDQLIRSLQKQINDLKMNAAFSPAEQVLVDAAGTNAEESSRQLEEATEMIESLREELETSHATTKEYKIQLNRALRERDRTVDETNRDADQRVKMAIDDAKKAQNAVYEQRKEMESMELLLNEAVRKQEIAESAFANVEATEIGEEDIPSRSSRRKKEKDYARGGGVKGVRAVMRKGSSGVGDDLDESYGADDFSDEDGYGEDGFD